MALISCPECGKEVSDKANSCPNCGYGIIEHFRSIERNIEAIDIQQTEKQEQTEEIEKYQKRLNKIPMPRKPKKYPFLIIVVFQIAFTLFVSKEVFADFVEYNSAITLEELFQNISFNIMFAILITFPITIPMFAYYDKKNRDYKFATKDFRAYKIEKIRVEDYKKSAQHSSKTIATNIGQVRCPKCGSTQIQAVTRKWSLLTGFLTNEVDRVCLNCKHKW